MKSVVLMLALCAVAFGQLRAEQPSTLPILFKGDDLMHPSYIAYAESMNYSLCYVGGRTILDNGVYTDDSAAPSICEYPGSKCGLIKTTTVDDGQTAYSEVGFCIPPMMETPYTCATYQNFTFIGEFTSCETSICEGNLCNVFQTESNTYCNKSIAENDINLTPAMTMRELFGLMDYCTKDLYSGYPYQSKDQCREKFNTAVLCAATVIVNTVNSPCLSVLDWIPGFRDQTANQRLALYYILQSGDIGQAWDGLANYFQLDKETADNIKMYIDEFSCPAIGEVPQSIEDTWMWAKENENDIEKAAWAWLEELGVDMSMVGMDMGMTMGMYSVCEEGYWAASMKASLDYMWSWYSAETREDTCIAVNTMQIRSTNAWNHMCDDMKVYPALIAMYGEENKASVDVIAKILWIWDDIYSSYEFPNCPASTQNRSPLGCEQYYGSTTACGIRKAWLCDYTDWKLEFLADWLTEYEAYEVNNILTPVSLDAPACDNFDMTDMCKNSGMQMCMTMPVTGCNTCYCTDHEYKDLSGLSEIWRKDYLGWQHVFRTYKIAFASATCKETDVKMNQEEDNMNMKK